LRQLGIAFQTFSHDHNSQFPMAVPRSAGGSQEFVQNAYRISGDFYFGFRHFQALSNDLGACKPLVCPADRRLPARNFADLKNENMSYFVSVSSTPDQPMSVLAGDRNLRAISSPPDNTLLRLRSGEFLQWTEELHAFKGNLLFADAHVERRNSRKFSLGPMVAGATPTDLVLPSTKKLGAYEIVAAPPLVSTNSTNPAPSVLTTNQGTNLHGRWVMARGGVVASVSGPAGVEIHSQRTPTRLQGTGLGVPVPPTAESSTQAVTLPPARAGSQTNLPADIVLPAAAVASAPEPPVWQNPGWQLLLLFLLLLLISLAIRYYFSRKASRRRLRQQAMSETLSTEEP
jgi:prepilin-type processing-associated H-X9-DG protein